MLQMINNKIVDNSLETGYCNFCGDLEYLDYYCGECLFIMCRWCAKKNDIEYNKTGCWLCKNEIPKRRLPKLYRPNDHFVTVIMTEHIQHVLTNPKVGDVNLFREHAIELEMMNNSIKREDVKICVFEQLVPKKSYNKMLGIIEPINTIEEIRTTNQQVQRQINAQRNLERRRAKRRQNNLKKNIVYTIK